MTLMIPAWVAGELQPVEKLEVHIKGLRHKAVSVFVMNGSRILLQKRADGKYHTPGLWANTCCTHPKWGETPQDCAVRRLREELGIEGLKPVWRQRLEYRADVGKGMVEHELVDVFCAEAGTDLPLALNPDEVSEIHWIHLDDLRADVARDPARYTPWLRIYLEQHSAEIFGT